MTVREEPASGVGGRAPFRSRWWRRVVLAAVALAGSAVFVWYGWLPQHRPMLLDGERHGIDVSHHQGVIDWQAVAGDDVGFAYIKATEGATHVDTRFADNCQRAAQAGIRRGACHFFTLCRTGAEQADLDVADLAHLEPDNGSVTTGKLPRSRCLPPRARAPAAERPRTLVSCEFSDLRGRHALGDHPDDGGNRDAGRVCRAPRP